MHTPTIRSIHRLDHPLQALLRAYAFVAETRLLLLLLLLLATLSLAAQFPRLYHIEVGQEDGVGSDLPMLADVYATERDAQGNHRWTTGISQIRLPGIGVRRATLMLRVAPVSTSMASEGPQSFQIVLNGQAFGQFPLRTHGGVYRALLPPANLSGDLQIALQSETYAPPSDTRALGINLDWVQLRTTAGALPPIRSTASWMVVWICGWIIMRSLGFGADATHRTLLYCIPFAGLAALLDAPRWAFGAEVALTSVLLAGGLAIMLDRIGTPLLVRSGIAVVGWPWRTLCLGAALIFALRYGGKLYPDSMPGDIGFHINRFIDTLRGDVFLLSKNRGVAFPYPPALYILIAPLTLILDIGVSLQIVGALLDALSPFLVYVIALRSGLIRDQRFAVGAALFYGLCGAGFMPTWWNFSTHIFAQAAHLLLMAFLIVVLPGPRVVRYDRAANGASWPTDAAQLRSVAALAIVLQLTVYLGHFGFWLNTTLLVGLSLVVMVLLLFGRDRARWRVLWRWVAVAILAQLIVLLIFYSAYSALIVEQIQRAATGGLTGLAGRARSSPALLWQILRDGLYQHIGLIPAPLALCALALRRGRRHARILLSATLLLAVVFAVLPFLTGSTLATRWLMFSIWAIAVLSAAIAEHLWRSGRAARVVVWAISIYVFWISASLWLGALAWRLRPIEPF